MSYTTYYGEPVEPIRYTGTFDDLPPEMERDSMIGRPDPVFARYGDDAKLQACANRICERVVGVGTEHCCAACSYASGRHEIHDNGDILSHSGQCEKTWAARQEHFKAQKQRR